MRQTSRPSPLNRQLLWLLMILLGVLLGATLFFHLYSDHLNRQLAETTRQHTRSLHTVNDALARFGTLHNRVTLLVEQQEANQLRRDEAERQQQQLERDLQTLVDETRALQALLPANSALQPLAQEIARQITAYQEQIRILLPLLHSDTDEAEAETVNITQQVSYNLAQLVNLSRTRYLTAQADYEQTLDHQMHFSHQVELGLLALILLILLLPIWRLHQLGRQLGITEQALLQLGEGHTDLQLPPPTSTFAPLFAALEQFRQLLLHHRDTLRVLSQHQQHLEQTVAERTAHLQQANRQLEDEMRQRQQAEKRRRLFEIVFEHTEDAVIITTPDSHIVAANPAYLLMTGLTQEELAGKRPPISSSGHHDKAFYQQLWRELSHNGRWQGEIINRHVDGGLIHALLTINAAYDPDGTLTHYVGILSDITQLKAAENQLKRLAYFDPLTALPNRVMLKNRLEHEIEIAREEQQTFATLLLDLDRFKLVNDTLGHKAGDELLMDVAERLRGTIRLEDTVARLSGDEFCLIIRDCDPSHVAHVAEAIVHVLNLPFRLEEREVEVGASVGIAMYPDDGQSTLTLMKNADAAMYQAKALGRNRYCFFEPAIETRLRGEMELFARLRQAIDSREFVLYYQPVEPQAAGVGCYGEALIRWPQGGSMGSPGVFIPFAENHGLIEAIGDFVIEEACAFVARSIDAGHPQTVSINLSAKQLAMSDLVSRLTRQVSERGIPPSAIELELTESSLIQNLSAIAGLLTRLRQAGFRIAIDDFGAGYSSLNYLVELPIDKVKIDQRFIWSLFNSPRNQAVVKAILELARSIGVQSVAEGVETAEQLAFLRAHGCDYIQGYHLSRPLSEADYLRYRLGTAAPQQNTPP